MAGTVGAVVDVGAGCCWDGDSTIGSVVEIGATDDGDEGLTEGLS